MRFEVRQGVLVNPPLLMTMPINVQAAAVPPPNP
jgi:hypothetical protein